MNNLLNNAEFVVVGASASAGQTELTTDVIDMAGFTGVVFVVHLGDVTNGSVLGLAADHSDDADADFEDLEGPLAHTANATNADNKVLVLDIVRPEKRFVRARLTRGTANAIVNGVLAIKYGPLHAPIEQGDTVLASETLPNGKPVDFQFG
jgi:hypothetical protein